MIDSVLIVDDNPISYFTTAKFLKKMNLAKTVVCTDSAEKALSLILKECPSLIILDLNMPVMNGYTLMKNLSVQMPDYCSKTKLIILTDASYQDEINKYQDVHFDAFFSKPLKAEDVDEILKLFKHK